MMANHYRFSCSLRNGLHARPASMLADVARRFSATITLAKDSGGTPVDIRSVLSVVGLDVKHGEICIVCATGTDADAAIAALRELIERELADADEAPQLAAEHAVARLPMTLKRLNVAHVAGRPASRGIARGAAVIVEGLALPPELRSAEPGPVDHELESARRAIAAVRDDLQRRSGAAAGIETDLLRAHAGIADDPVLWAEVERRIRAGSTAAQAVVGAAEFFSAQLRSAGSAYIRDRVVDVHDVCMQLLDRLAGGRLAAMHITLTRDSIVFAETLTANQLLRLDRRRLRGLVLGPIGATAHTVILARSLRIPTLIDVENAPHLVPHDASVVVDADGGFVLTSITEAVTRYYERESRTHDRWHAHIAPLAQARAVSADGAGLEIGANASTADEVTVAVDHGADGVGLLRTELLFLERSQAPTEDEQFEAYSAAVSAAQGRTVIIRTFDIGGDKPAEYIPMAREENPFLGVRGLRLYERHPSLLRLQLRAILRASAIGPIKIMAPMVATPVEAAWFREEVRNVQAQLRVEGVRFDEAVPIGIMIEVPSTALVMDQLAAEVGFFSLGTNDLCQYWMAVDRGNAGVAALYNPRHPSFLRLLRTIVAAAHKHGRWIGVCGEMAGDRLNLPLMLGLGVDEISVAPGEVLTLKSAVHGASSARCRDLLAQAENCTDAAQVELLLTDPAWRGGASLPILHPDLIETGADAQSKEEAIKSAVDLLFIAGRTERPRAVEEAVWAREETYSTGLGFGFAVPHCKTDAVAAPTLAVLRLASPIEWGSMDGQPVRTVLLLAIPAADATGAHMKVFARLARKLMHDGFRDRLSSAADARAILAILKEELQLD